MTRDQLIDSLPPRPSPAPWTASRCNRVLRRLSSFVNKLEKWHQDFLAASEEADTEENHVSAKPEPQSTWLSRDNGLKPKRTYKTRRKTAPPTPALKPSRRCLTTPKNNTIQPFTKLRSELETSRDRATENAEEVSEAVKRTIGVRINRKKWTAQTAYLAESFKSILRDGSTTIPTFLVATSDPKRPFSPEPDETDSVSKTGVRCLSDMCLASLSQNLVAQQRDDDACKDGYEGQHDLIGSQLQELEEYFGDAKNGWPPLREVVRNCGITMIKSLIFKGALPEETATDMVLCWGGLPMLSDFVEAIKEAIVEAQSGSLSNGANFQDLPCPGIFTSFTELQLGRMLQSQRISKDLLWEVDLSHRRLLCALASSSDPVRLLNTEFRFDNLCFFVEIARLIENHKSLIGGLLYAVYRGALGKWSTDVLHDLRQPLQNSQDREDCRASTTGTSDQSLALFPRLRLGLCPLLIDARKPKQRVLARLVAEISHHVQILVEAGWDLYASDSQRTLMVHICFADLCRLLAGEKEVPSNLLRCFESLLSSDKFPGGITGDLTSTIILPFGRELKTVQGIVERMISLDCGDFKTLHILLVKTATFTAMEYATENSTNPAILPWALDVHQRTRKHLQRLRQCDSVPPELDTSPAYQWDAAIEEWIVDSPTPQRKEGERDEGTTCIQNTSLIGALTSYQSLAVSIEAKCRPRIQPHSSFLENKSAVVIQVGERLNRKRKSVDFEFSRDGDFEYKRPKRRSLPAQRPATKSAGMTRMVKRLDKENQGIEDESDDELSLLD